MTWVDMDRSSSSIARFRREIARERSISSCWADLVFEISDLRGERGDVGVREMLPFRPGWRCVFDEEGAGCWLSTEDINEETYEAASNEGVRNCDRSVV